MAKKPNSFTVGPITTKSDVKAAAKTIGLAFGPKTGHAANCLTVIAWPNQEGFCTCGITPLPENTFEKAFDVGREYAEEDVGIAIDAQKGIDTKKHSEEYVKGWCAAMDQARDIAYHMPYGSEWYENAAEIARKIAAGEPVESPFGGLPE